MAEDGPANCRNFSTNMTSQWSTAVLCSLTGKCDDVTNYTLSSSSNSSSSLTDLDLGTLVPQWAQHNALQTFVLILATYVTPIFVGIGLVTNTMSLLVFAGTYLKHQSMSVYLAALACADSVFLVSLLMHWLTFVSIDVIAVQGVCQLVVYASFCSCFLSIWFLVSCSVERYIAICHPLRKPEMCTTRRACAVVLGLVVFCCVAYSVTLWMAGVSVTCTGHRVCEPVRGGGRARRLAQIVTDVIATLVLPFLVIVILNTAISKSMASFYRGHHQVLTLVDSYSSTSSTAVLLVTPPTLVQPSPSPLAGSGSGGLSRSPLATTASLPNVYQPSSSSAAAAAAAAGTASVVTTWSRQISAPACTSSSVQHPNGRARLTLTTSLAIGGNRNGGGGGGGTSSPVLQMQGSGSAMGGEPMGGGGGGGGVSRKHASRTLSSSLYTRAQMKLTKMLLLLSSLFLLFNLPDYVMRFHMFFQTISGTPGSHTQMLLAEIFHFAHNVTFATKFLLFYVCSAKFREAFKRFWWQASYKVVRSCRTVTRCPLRRSRQADDSTSERDNEAFMAISARANRLAGTKTRLQTTSAAKRKA